MVVHPRTKRRAREQVKAMVNDDVSLPQIKAYLNQWLRCWQNTSGIWNYQELSNAYIQSCWDPTAATIAATAFQQQQNDFIRLGNCEDCARCVISSASLLFLFDISFEKPARPDNPRPSAPSAVLARGARAPNLYPTPSTTEKTETSK